jgi:hypothetical protein
MCLLTLCNKSIYGVVMFFQVFSCSSKSQEILRFQSFLLSVKTEAAL